MCGIVGAVGLLERPSPDVARTLLDSIRHRGPDASGEMFRDGVWLGSRRLKVLDLRDDANQPMCDAASGIGLVYNGEIYNYIELRSTLERAGHRFVTTGDTEVLLRGYLEWKDELFQRCSGMWAVAIHDPQRAGVLICRDRFGEKPLFVGRDSGGPLWFGSEARTVRLAGAGSGQYDHARVLNFLAFGDAEDPNGSFFDGIVQLPPGHLALLTEHGAMQSRPWWDLAEVSKRAWGTRAPSREEQQHVIDEAVRVRLRSDVAVGSSLSGGVDSSMVLASIRSVEPTRSLHVFTASFPDHGVDEWPIAQRVAEHFGAEAHRVEPTVEGFLEELPLLVIRQGAPFDSPSVYSQWCVMREAATNGVVVLLDGQGADETWGGYRKYVWFAFAEALMALQLGSSRRIMRNWHRAGDLPPPDALQVAGLALPAWARQAARVGLRHMSTWVGSALRDRALVDPQGDKLHAPLLRQAAVADGRRVILPRLLRYADRNSMAWSRELRLPYLDERVVELGFSSGWRPGFEAGWTKEPLRQLVEQRVFPEVAWRRAKVAYDIPDLEWLSHPHIRERLASAVSVLRELRIVGPSKRVPLPPWRVISLACFLDEHGLSS